VYEAKAIVKIGEYKLNNNNNNNNRNNKVTIANASELTKELEVLYIDLLKNQKDRIAEIKSISLVKKQNNLFEIVANGNSNETASNELNKVIYYVQEKHQKLLDDVRELREAQMKNVKNKLSLLKTKTLPALKEKISRYKNDIKMYKKNFKDIQENLKKIRNSNPTMAALQINEGGNLAKLLIDLRRYLEGYISEQNRIEMIEISNLEKELNSLISSMKPYNYKNTEVIGNIMTNDYAIKPKKKLIVIVAFITGFILSIFLVFFLEFIKGFKED
jgi:uncharacterized protein involved in exopolysaccharide biosynthesis